MSAILPRIVAIVPIHQGMPQLEKCLNSIAAQQVDGFMLDTVVVDCGSTDGSAEYIRASHPKTHVIQGHAKMWWGHAMKEGNKWASEKDYDFVFWVNHDDVFSPLTVATLLKHHRPHRICACGVIELPNQRFVLCGYDITPYRSWWIHPIHLGRHEFNQHSEPISFSVHGGHGVLIPMDVARAVSLQPWFLPHYYADADFYMRARKLGVDCVVVPGVTVLTDPLSRGIPGGRFLTQPNQILPFLFSHRSGGNARDRTLFALRNFPIGANLIWAAIFFMLPWALALLASTRLLVRFRYFPAKDDTASESS